MFGVGDGAEADFPEAQSFQAFVFEFFHQPLADVAVQDAVGVCLVAEDEGDVDDVEVGGEAGEVGRAGHFDVNRAAAHAANHRLRVAEGAVGEERNFQLATAFFFDDVGEFFRGDVLGVAARRFVAEAEAGGSMGEANAEGGSGDEGGEQFVFHGFCLVVMGVGVSS